LEVRNLPFQPTEGAAFSGTVATFTDTDSGAAGDFTATINWGDGTTSARTIAAGAPGGFPVPRPHTHPPQGAHPHTATPPRGDRQRHDGGGRGLRHLPRQRRYVGAGGHVRVP